MLTHLQVFSHCLGDVLLITEMVQQDRFELCIMESFQQIEKAGLRGGGAEELRDFNAQQSLSRKLQKIMKELDYQLNGFRTRFATHRRNHPESSGIIRNHPESPGIIRNHPDSHGQTIGTINYNNNRIGVLSVP